MAVLKCKMCGGELTVEEGSTVAVCEYCGSKQTVPDADDEKKVNLFNRANRLRMASEFDKAAGIYEQIIAEFPEEAEAYWGLCLANYGIEYVDDPATAKKIPTCHRASFEKMRKDENYELALENADMTARIVYEEQAREIDRIMGEILKVSRDEKPYDIFICYKENDSNGSRTPDSVLAQDIYDALTAKGYRVFFSRISLEDKLGTQYEPYIFSALNSAKMMLAIGTDYEYMNAVWVKNEWSRFIKLIAKDKTRVLIPCYKDMDPYDMPDELKAYQSQDCGKLGFLQDLTRGINKLFGKLEKGSSATSEKVIIQQATSGDVINLLKRMFMFLEDENWESAKEYSNKVLDIDSENGEAYLGALMAELKVSTREKLKDCKNPFEEYNTYRKILRFGSPKLVGEVKGYIEFIKGRNENVRLTGIYIQASNVMKTAKEESDYKTAAKIYNTIPGFRDADQLASECLIKAEKSKAELDKQVDEVGKALMCEKARKNIKKAESNVNRLESELKTVEELSRNLSDFDKEIFSVNNEISNLIAYRTSLGLFEVAEKKNTDAKIRALEAKKSELSASKKTLLRKLEDTRSESVIRTELEEKRQELEKVQNEQPNESSVLSLEEANRLLYDGNKPALKVIEKVIVKYPAIESFIIPQLVIKMGRYRQNSEQDEPIEWKVLNIENGRAMVVSKYALNCKPYNKERVNITWEGCSLRTWLNGEFFNTAFTEDEKEQIAITKVPAHKNPEYNIDPGKATEDRIFLLSIEETEKYFTSEKERECKLTKYAVSKRTYDCRNGNWWWLRSPGYDQYRAAFSYNAGLFDFSGYYVDRVNVAVRPAMWINLDS